MEVLLLGTGTGAGWPNPHCRCGSCGHARATGDSRGPTAALVDDRLLLDLGPDVGRAAGRAGRDLVDLAAVLVTHAHSDHCDPSTLCYRGWANRAPLEVFGPPAVIEACRPWLEPAGSPVSLRVVHAGDELTVAGYRVRVLPADHEAFGEAVLYDVTDAAGARMLYATDTGPWTAAALDLLAGRGYDLVLLEETFGDRPLAPGHHTIETFTAAVTDLRSRAAIHAGSDIVAVHLDHHNPPLPRLTDRLAEAGARIVPDLTTIIVAAGGTKAPAVSP